MIMEQSGWADSPDFDPQTVDRIREVEKLTIVHGVAPLRDALDDYMQKLADIARLNRSLSELREGQAAFAETVDAIMAATQSYYNFITSLPDDIRRFLLSLSGAEDGSQDPLAETAKLVGLSAAPLELEGQLSIQAIRPRNYIMQIDAITNQLAHSAEGQLQVRVGHKGSQPIHTTVTLDMPDHMKIEGGTILSTYDKSIINGVTSLLESGNSIFSLPMLYHAMTGKQNPTVDDALAEELTAKLEKMRRMILTIDLSEENEARYLTTENGETLKIEDLQLEGYLLPLNKVSGMVNGKRAELYQIIQHPPLYTYSKIKRQLATVKISLLDAPINNNSTTIPLKTYLLQRVEMMKNKKNAVVSQTILYESVYAELGATDANKTKKMRIRNYTTVILQHFINQGYLNAFTEYKKGRSIAGIKIDL